MQPPDHRVVLTLPAGARFGGVARSAVGALARRGGFSALQWARLEAAVDRTLRLLQRHPGDRVRLTFGDEGALAVEGDAGVAPAISVEAEVATERGRPPAGGPAAPQEVERLRADLTALVDLPEVDPAGAWVRFRAPRQ